MQFDQVAVGDEQHQVGAVVGRDPASVKACGGGTEQMMEPAE
mgnify:CR=1 FL=1